MKMSLSEKQAGAAGWAERPKSAGVAMNPIDHPHGGGEGRWQQAADIR